MRRTGRFEAAHGGTLFLDEIGTLSPAGQVKLLRAVQSGEFERLGSSTTRRVDVRVLAATNLDLAAAIAAGRFREDLYFRLNVVELRVPGLAERREDILPLARHFLRMHALPTGGTPPDLAADAEAALLAHGWPGNVRELANTMVRAAFTAPGGVIRAADLGLAAPPAVPVTAPAPPLTTADADERRTIEQLLLEEHGMVSRAAARLGMSRQALYRRMERLGIVLERRPRAEDR